MQAQQYYGAQGGAPVQQQYYDQGAVYQQTAIDPNSLGGAQGYGMQTQMQQDPYQAEDPYQEIERNEMQNGVRFTWNELPLNRPNQERAVFKPAGLYTPLKTLQPNTTGVVAYEPVRCKAQNCQGVLNPFAVVDYQSKTWTCPFCYARNSFPTHYAAAISETNLPAELLHENSTIEYQLNRVVGPPVFLFVIDTAIASEELDELKDSLQQALTLLPPSSLVGLITFGANVQVHELGFQMFSGAQQQQQPQQPTSGSHVCSKAYVFKGEKGVAPEKIFSMLGMFRPGQVGATPNPAGPGAAPGAPIPPAGAHMPPGVERFLAPKDEISASLEAIIEDLRKDPWPVARENRPQRCTGVAMSVAVTMLEKMCSKRGARIMMFIGGPPTVGEGAVAGEKLALALRSHTDIEKGRATLLKPAKAFYDKLAQRLVENGHTLDMFICSLDQTGLLEMKACVESTGGYAVLADSFGQSVFKESFRRVFSRHPDHAHDADRGHLTMGLCGTLEFISSPEIKIKGAIGPCASLAKKGPNVSDIELGQGGTYAWRLCAMDPTSTVAFYLDTQVGEGNSHATRPWFIQFITHYQHGNGKMRIRVTTVTGRWQQDPNNIKCIAHSFDQQATVVCLARIAVHRIESDAPLDIIRFIDRSLIKFSSQFAHYRKDDASSFALSNEFSLFPQFLFHLRRSPFLQVFNSSPDEACYHRLTLLRENTTDSIVMIQPSLCSYSLANGAQAQPVLLDSTSIRPDTILLLDTFFQVVVFHGETIAAWREQGYQDHPDHQPFRRLLNAPKDDAQLLMQTRIPQPRYIVCDQHKSQSRFLVSRVDPSTTHHNAQDGDYSAGGQAVFTDDASFKSFMDHLRKIAVQSDGS